MARWVRRRDRAGRVLVIANQKPGVLERYGVTPEEAGRAAWTVESARRLEGAAAINRVFEELGGGWRAVAAVYRLPPLAMAEEAFYRWFARNRARFRQFGVKPECDELGAGCA